MHIIMRVVCRLLIELMVHFSVLYHIMKSGHDNARGARGGSKSHALLLKRENGQAARFRPPTRASATAVFAH